jgi:hypothetical protein
MTGHLARTAAATTAGPTTAGPTTAGPTTAGPSAAGPSAARATTDGTGPPAGAALGTQGLA